MIGQLFDVLWWGLLAGCFLGAMIAPVGVVVLALGKLFGEVE